MRILRSTVPLLALVAAAALPPAGARADLIFNFQEAPASVSAGSTGNTFEVTLTNNSATDVALGGFSFGISSSQAALSFTGASIDGTALPYIFAGQSATQDYLGTDDISTMTGASLMASDNADNGGYTLSSGASIALGEVSFDVAAGTPPETITLSFQDYPITSLNDSSNADLGAGALDVSATLGIRVGAAATPEPSSLVLTGIGGAVGLAWARRHRKARPVA